MALSQTPRVFRLSPVIFRTSSRRYMNNLPNFLQITKQSFPITHECFVWRSHQIGGFCQQHLRCFSSHPAAVNPTATVDDSSGKKQVVLIKRLPRSSNKEFVLECFKDVKIRNGKEGVKFLYKNGLYMGEALIWCDSEEDAEKLLMYHNHKFENATLLVSRLNWDASNVFTCQENTNPEATADSTVIFITGFKNKVEEQEIREFLKGIEVAPNGISLKPRMVKVQLTSLEMVEKACQRNLQKLNEQPLRVWRSNLKKLDSPLPIHTVHLEGKSAEYKLKLFMLPQSVQSEEILNFLSPLKPVRVDILTNLLGVSKGRAVVEFENEEQCVEAIKKIRTDEFGRHQLKLGVARFNEFLRSFA